MALLSLSMLFSCEKQDTPEPNATVLNITYPAAYVALYGENAISVINLDSQRVTDRIPLPSGGQPYRMALSPDESRLLVSMQKADNGTFPILVMDATTGKEINSIPLDESAMNAVWSPDGKEVWLALRNSGRVQVFDATRGFEKTHEIETESGAGEITFSFDGVYVIVSNTAQDKIHFIHTLTKTVDESIAVGASPISTYASALQKVFTANQNDRTMTVVRTDNFQVETTVELDYRPGPMHYTLSDFHLWVMDTEGNKVVRYQKFGTDWVNAGAVATGDEPNHFALTEDNTLLLVTNRNDGTVSFIDVLGQSNVGNIPVGGEPCGIFVRE